MPTLIEIARAYILRGEAYSALQEHFTEGGFKDYTDGQKCMDRIKAIPAADVVEVVRCRDCSRKDSCRAFTIWAVPPADNWYCAGGEKKEAAK